MRRWLHAGTERTLRYRRYQHAKRATGHQASDRGGDSVTLDMIRRLEIQKFFFPSYAASASRVGTVGCSVRKAQMAEKSSVACPSRMASWYISLATFVTGMARPAS